ncbi:hypothetical protein [Roseateles sp. L2-2]|uniref:hypothetical protein n=1 Tax=Roseateles TaxID=93681 RepID=UPI003D35BFA5
MSSGINDGLTFAAQAQADQIQAQTTLLSMEKQKDQFQNLIQQTSNELVTAKVDIVKNSIRL